MVPIWEQQAHGLIVNNELKYDTGVVNWMAAQRPSKSS